MSPIGNVNSASSWLAQRSALQETYQRASRDSVSPAELARLSNVVETGPGLTTEETGGPQKFGEMLGNLVQGVAAKQAAAGEANRQVLLHGANGPVPLHEAVIASEEAGVAFQFMVEVRNKLLESYQEIMRMQV